MCFTYCLVFIESSVGQPKMHQVRRTGQVSGVFNERTLFTRYSMCSRDRNRSTHRLKTNRRFSHLFTVLSFCILFVDLILVLKSFYKQRSQIRSFYVLQATPACVISIALKMACPIGTQLLSLSSYLSNTTKQFSMFCNYPIFRRTRICCIGGKTRPG